MLVLIITLVVSMSISFFCSLLEATLLSLTLSDIAKISETKPKIAKIWLKFKEHIQKPIAVILIANTFAHTIGASVSGAQFDKLIGPEWLALFSIAYSWVMIQWTEILPKTLGVRNNQGVAKASAIPMSITIKLFTPILLFVQWMNKPFESKKKSDSNVDPLSEISTLAHFAANNNVISSDQENIVDRTMNLSKLTVRDIMVKKTEMKILTVDMSLGDALIQAHLHHHTRLPLVDTADMKTVFGYVNFKDIVSALRINPADPTLKGISRPILTINTEDPIAIALNKLIRSYQHIALVKEPDGTVSGLLTLENILEMIVGEIQDEYDIVPDYFYPLTETRFVCGGGCTLAQINSTLECKFSPDTLTVNEWLKGMLGGIPKPEDKVEFQNVRFIIRKVSRSLIYEAILEKKDASPLCL